MEYLEYKYKKQLQERCLEQIIGCFNLIFYNSAEDAVFKALGVE